MTTIATAPAVAPATTSSVSRRINSLDLLRGIVMVLMAIDHVRVYSGVPAGGPTVGIFFTRWITHFCAPVFVFLAGAAAFLHGRKLASTSQLSRYLFTRGLMLVVLELTVIRLSWTFTFSSIEWMLAGVIWMLGWCMVLMSGLVRLPLRAIVTLGVLLIMAQDIAGPILGALPSALSWLGQFLYLGGEVAIGSATMTVLYTIVPWIGVMAVGYAFGAIVIRPPDERRRLCLRIGLAATALFLVIGGVGMFVGSADDTGPWLFRLLNQRKYPASQLFLLMTLGPAIALLPLADRARGWLADLFVTFGRVPMFYYLLHIPVIHLIALGVWLLRDSAMNNARFATAPYVSIPEPARWGLPLLYLVFAVSVAALYFPCRWYGRVKLRYF